MCAKYGLNLAQEFIGTKTLSLAYGELFLLVPFNMSLQRYNVKGAGMKGGGKRWVERLEKAPQRR